jgi:hypothetical protein
MNRDGRSSSHDPTAEPERTQSTQTASGLTIDHDGPGLERNRLEEETVNRSEADTTPRRYEQPIEADDDPVMPGDDATLNTKI